MKSSTTRRRRGEDRPRSFWGKAWYYFTAVMTFFVAMDGEGVEHTRESDQPKRRAARKARP